MSASASAAFAKRSLFLASWAFAVWLLITWTATAESLGFGAGVALIVGIALSPMGEVVAPWRVIDPRRLVPLMALTVLSLGRIVRANLVLAWRIWSPRRPLHSGMIIVPTELRSETTLGAVGLVTSLIVDNQVVDVDTRRNEFQYHAVSVPDGDSRERSEHINAPTERMIARIARRR